jgi:hypothetical protein
MVPTALYQSGKARARLTIALLVAIIVLDLSGIGSGFLQINLLSRAVAGNVVTEEEVAFNDLRHGTIVGLRSLAYLCATIAFLLWIHRAYKNLPALGARNLQYSPGWAVGWWFIPFANLIYPFRVVREIWNKSDPAYDPETSFLWEGAGAPALLGWWWGLWIISNLAGHVVYRMFSNARSPDQFLLATQLDMAASLITVAAAALAILVVKGISERQEERERRYGPQGMPPPPPIFAQNDH